MRCEDVQSAIVDARYDDAELDSNARAHLEGCEHCRAQQSSAETLDTLLALDTSEPPGPGFDTRFFARLKEQRKRPTKAWPGWVRWAFAAMATPALAFSVLFGLRTTEVPSQVAMSPADMAMVAELDLLEALPVVEKLDELETYELLASVDMDELNRMLGEEGTP